MFGFQSDDSQGSGRSQTLKASTQLYILEDMSKNACPIVYIRRYV